MTPIAATVAIVVALMVGYYWARWRRSEASLRAARGQADAAGKAAWRSRILIIAGRGRCLRRAARLARGHRTVTQAGPVSRAGSPAGT